MQHNKEDRTKESKKMQTEAKAVIFPRREQGTMRKITTMAATMALAVALSASAASAVDKRGTNAGEVINGTAQSDTIYALGGPDLVRGYSERDFLYGGNEAGYGDKIKGGTWGDRIFGQDGHDALYGEDGDDEVRGGFRNDIVAGGPGNDILDGGPGADRTNAYDGEKDTIVIRFGEGDVVYYDKGLDVLVVQSSPQGNTSLTASEIGDKQVELSAQRPPEGIFEPSGKVLVEHGGEELLVAEQALEAHLAHGDKIIDPTGRASAEEGR